MLRLSCAFQLVYGRLSDIVGRKIMLQLAMALLALGNLLCSFAQTPIQLYAFRSISGIGGGGINNIAMVIVRSPYIVALREGEANLVYFALPPIGLGHCPTQRKRKISRTCFGRVLTWKCLWPLSRRWTRDGRSMAVAISVRQRLWPSTYTVPDADGRSGL